MLKKIIAIFFCLIFLLQGCNNGNSPTDNNEEKVRNDVDLGGYECVIFQEWPLDAKLLNYKTDTPLYDSLKMHIKEIEEEMNCVIPIVNLAAREYDMIQFCINNTVAGDTYAELVFGDGANMLQYLAYADVLYPLTELQEHLDYTEFDKYGPPSYLECAMLNSIPYAVAPIRWPEMEAVYSYTIALNKDMIKQYSLYDPREFLDKKAWNWENFEKVLTDFYADEGERKITAISADKSMFVAMALPSNGVNLIKKEGDTIKTDIYSDKAVYAVDWVKNLYANFSDRITPRESMWSEGVFAEKQTFMGLTYTRYFTGWTADFVPGVMPFPSGPDGEYGKWAHSFATILGFGIPVTAEDPEFAAQVLNRLCDYMSEYSDQDKLVNYYQRLVFDEKRDAEMYLSLGAYGRYSYWPVGGNDLNNAITSGLEKSTATELLQKFGPSYEKVIEKYISTNYDFLEKYLFN